MTPDQWARVFRAGWKALGYKAHKPADALAITLRAMEMESKAIAEETS